MAECENRYTRSVPSVRMPPGYPGDAVHEARHDDGEGPVGLVEKFDRDLVAPQVVAGARRR